MSGIVVYTGHWENRFVVSPSEDDEAMFRARALGRLLLVYSGRSLVMEPAFEGNKLIAQPRDRNAGRGYRYQWRIRPRPWARWMNHPIELSVGDSGTLTINLPDDHELPWPKMQSCNGSIDLRAVAHREFWVRAGSAYEAGGREGLKCMMQTMPDNVRRYLSRDSWDMVVSEVTVNGNMRPTGEELWS